MKFIVFMILIFGNVAVRAEQNDLLLGSVDSRELAISAHNGGLDIFLGGTQILRLEETPVTTIEAGRMRLYRDQLKQQIDHAKAQCAGVALVSVRGRKQLELITGFTGTVYTPLATVEIVPTSCLHE